MTRARYTQVSLAWTQHLTITASAAAYAGHFFAAGTITQVRIMNIVGSGWWIVLRCWSIFSLLICVAMG